MLFGKEKENYKDKKSIVIYFSRADENYSVGYIDRGNTEVIAEYIGNIAGATLFKVEPKEPYSKDYNTCTREAKTTQASHNAPIKENIPDLTEYDVIYIGSPVYWGYAPRIILTFLDSHNLDGKTVIPFCTSGGSGISSSVSYFKSHYKNVNFGGEQTLYPEM